MPMLMSTSWHHSQHQNWPFLNSNIYIWHQGACCEGGAQGWCLWTLFSLMRMLPCRNRLFFWKSHVDIMKQLTATFPPCRTHILVQILCRKWRDFHQELPVLKDNSTCNSIFPHQLSNSPNLRHSALRLLVIKGKFPSNRHVPTQEVLDLAVHLQLPARSSSSHCLRVPGPSALVFPRIRSASSPSAPPHAWGENVELPSQSQGSQQQMKLSFTSQGAFLLWDPGLNPQEGSKHSFSQILSTKRYCFLLNRERTGSMGPRVF